MCFMEHFHQHTINLMKRLKSFLIQMFQARIFPISLSTLTPFTLIFFAVFISSAVRVGNFQRLSWPQATPTGGSLLPQ